MLYIYISVVATSTICNIITLVETADVIVQCHTNRFSNYINCYIIDYMNN